MITDSSTRATHWLRAQKAEARSPLRKLWLLAPLGGALIVAQAWLLAQIIHAAVFESAAVAALQPALLGLLGVFALRFVVSRQTERQAFHAATAVKRALRERLFDKLRALGPLQLATQESGAISTSLIDGVEQLDAYFARFVPALTLVSVVPLVILLATLPSDGLSAVVLLVTAPLLVLFMVLIGNSAEAMSQRQWRELSRMGAYFLDLIQTLATRKMFNASRRELTQIARVSDAFRRTTMSVLRVAFLTSAVLEFFAAISIALIAVFIGFRLLAGEMQFVHGFFVLLLAPEFYLPLRNYGVQNHARMEAVGAAEQIVRILELPETEGMLGAESAATEAQPELSGAIELQQLSFAYEAGRPALSELTLRIEAGEHLAIVGPSGAGKTTLLQLLLGFAWADRGAILIGGQALTPATVRAWRRQLGWIPQRASLFHGSVADNLRLGAPLASDADLRDALRQAQASDFVDALPQGLDTVVGDGGCGLSGGQIQRLAIARALLRQPRYLLLDEPTAHLDPENERRVTDALQQVSAGRTVINITHRLASLRHADRIAVLSGGAIVQLGRYDTLANTPGLFAQMLHERRELSA